MVYTYLVRMSGQYVMSGAREKGVGKAKKRFWLKMVSRRKKGFTQIGADKGADLPWKGLADFLIEKWLGVPCVLIPQMSGGFGVGW